MLLEKAVSQDGHRGEADVVHRQIGRIIQGLRGRGAGGGVEGTWREEGGGMGQPGIITMRIKLIHTSITSTQIVHIFHELMKDLCQVT